MNEEKTKRMLAFIALIPVSQASLDDPEKNDRIDAACERVSVGIKAGIGINAVDPRDHPSIAGEIQDVLADVREEFHLAPKEETDRARTVLNAVQFNLDANGGFSLDKTEDLPVTPTNNAAIQYIDTQLMAGIALAQIDRNALPQVGLVLDKMQARMEAVLPKIAPIPAPVKPSKLKQALTWLRTLFGLCLLVWAGGVQAQAVYTPPATSSGAASQQNNLQILLDRMRGANNATKALYQFSAAGQTGITIPAPGNAFTITHRGQGTPFPSGTGNTTINQPGYLRLLQFTFGAGLGNTSWAQNGQIRLYFDGAVNPQATFPV